MPHNFTRPTLPYANVSLPNDNRFQVLTRVLNSPPTDLIYDTEYNYLIDAANTLDRDIINVVAGNIPGSSNPANADGLVTTDGAGNLSFVKITIRNVTPASLPGTVLINSSVTGTQIGDGAITNNNLSPRCVTQESIANGAVGTNQIGDEAVETGNLAPLAVTAAQIANQTITATQIANQTITAAQIADNTITDGNILGPVSVPKGGSGLNTFTTPYGLICAGTTATGNLQNIGTGTIGQVPTSAGPTSLSIWTTPTQASVKANQITGTATNLYVNPAVQQFHASATKFWCMFDGTVTGTNPPVVGYNVTSVQRISQGLYQINFTVPFTSNNYCINITSTPNTGANGLVPALATVNANFFNFHLLRSTNSVAEDTSYICVSGFGTQ